MNERKLNQLFDAARKEAPPAPPEGFDWVVMQAVRRDGAPARPGSGSLLDQLNLLFPKLAWAAVALILLCVAGDFVSAAISPSLSDSVARISDQTALNADGF